jgi:EEF1A N-terminal glycine/lysine methyltransferase
LWNAGKVIAQYLEDNAENLVKGKDVLELGAGAGLPSLVCAARGARQVVVTDYPDPDLIQNLQYNIEHCSLISMKSSIVAKGYLWGNDTGELKSHLVEPSAGFDLLILADILFNHSEHEKLVSTVKATLKAGSNAKALVFFSPYRPWLLDKDLAFFDLAKSKGLLVQKVFEKAVENAMFATDPGDEMLRRTVFGYEMSQMHH